MQAVSIVRPYRNNIVTLPLKQKEPRTTPVKKQTACVIKDAETLDAIKARLTASSKKYGLRNTAIFVLGINCGLRCGDLLQIRLQDIWDEGSKSVKRRFSVLEEKTRKVRTIGLSEQTASFLEEYILTLQDRSGYTPLFPSQKRGKHKDTENRVKDNTGCLTRKSMWGILNGVAKELGIEHLATHSMRKTFSYNVYTKYKGKLVADHYSALDVLQKVLNHSSSNVTLRYIGVEAEVEDEIYNGMSL